MEFDEIFPFLGDFGLYQILLSCLIGVLSVFSGYNSIAVNFLVPKMKHWCKVDRLQNFTFEQQRYLAIPFEKSQTGQVQFSNCDRFSFNFTGYRDDDLFRLNRSEIDNGTVRCNNGWVYDRSEFASAATNEFNLVCNKSLLIQLAGTLYVAGMFIGAVSSGAISDKIGRKKTMLVYLLLQLGTGIGAAFSPNYAAFVILRLLVAVGMTGAYTCGFVIYMEVIGPKWRMPIGVGYQIWFSIGYMLQSGFAYSIRDFRRMQLAMIIPSSITLIFYLWLVPESPRWLISNNKVDEAKKIIHRMASINRRELPAKLELEAGDTKEGDEVPPATLLDLFKTPNLRKVTLIQYLCWFTCTLLYYGLSLNIANLAGSVFMNNFLSGLVEIPANIICIIVMKFAGRRYAIGGGFIFAGLMMFGTIPLLNRSDLSGLRTALSMLAKAGVTVSFSGVYVWSAELFPTVVRNVGIGSASTISRISGMGAPYIGGPLKNVWLPFPSVIFGIFGVGAGISAFFLPETLNQPLPETIDEAENFGKDKKKGKFKGLFNRGFIFDHGEIQRQNYEMESKVMPEQYKAANGIGST